MINCKNCAFFEQAYWHPALSSNNEKEPQMGGHCRLLAKILQHDNSQLFMVDRLYVNWEFGCIAGKPQDIVQTSGGFVDISQMDQL